MRDNVSIIFAAIFSVLLLIVFPLFSLLTRQDNIAYNKVLTITTEFVDSVRTKGYFTEKEYTDYLTKLAGTQNTYKVEMECHKKILIKDVEKYTDENPIWTEDTAVYYNSYIENELKNSGSVGLEEGDEFYIKVYNTNITTASLMYNFFLGSSIPRKVINIGYGGKVLNSTGATFVKTTFNSLYTPYVTFEEVVNSNDENFKYCYEQEAGTYEMQRCVRIIDIDDLNNNPIKVNFKLHNFARIGQIDLSSETFEENKSYFVEVLKEYISLRADYINYYEVEIEDLRYIADSVEGTIVISDIGMSYGVTKTFGYIVIGTSLGTGPTGAVSSEGTTEELTLIRRDTTSDIVVNGPYSDKDSTDIITNTLTNKETVYYKVTLKNADEIKKLELFDTLNATTIASYSSIKNGDEFSDDKFKINVEMVEKTSTANEYWISITPTFSDEIDEYIRLDFELQLVVYADIYTDVNVTSEFKAISKVVAWKSVIVDIACERVGGTNLGASLYFSKDDESEIENYIKNKYGKANATTRYEFFNSLAKGKIIYLTRSDTGEKKGINIKSVSGPSKYNNNTYYYTITYSEVLEGGPAKVDLYFNFKNSNTDIKSAKVSEYINIPLNTSNVNAGINDGLIYMQIKSNKYYWIPADVDDIDDTNAYYDNNITSDKVKDSIRKYGGFFVKEKLDSENFKNFNTVFEERSSDDFDGYGTLFSSIVYKWQLEKLYSELGKNLNSKVDFEIVDKPRVFVAETSSKGITAAYWDNSAGEFKYIDVEKEATKSFKSLTVLYIK